MLWCRASIDPKTKVSSDQKVARKDRICFNNGASENKNHESGKFPLGFISYLLNIVDCLENRNTHAWNFISGWVLAFRKFMLDGYCDDVALQNESTVAIIGRGILISDCRMWLSLGEGNQCPL